MTYSELKDKQPEMIECFFAYSDEQYEKGITKHSLHDKKVYSANPGLYGTSEGIKQFFDAYDKIHEEIKEQCTSQEVYDYEFANHECNYTGDDSEALEIVKSYFGEGSTKDLNRFPTYI